MKKLFILLAAVAALAFAPTSNASITNAYWYDDGDGVIQCESWGWNSGASRLWMDGVHNSTPQDGVTGHMVGLIQTDTVLDPIFNLGGSIENDTGGAWLGYTINVIMNSAFSIGPTFPTVDNPPNSDGWFVAGVGQPTLQVSGPWAGLWKGDIVYSQGAGSAINVGQFLDFSYTINFSGMLNFSFTQEMIPSFSYIPEPSGLVLAGMGALALALRMRRKQLS